MYVIYTRCAACDVHKKTVVVTVLITEPDGTVKKQTRTFSTMTADLLALDEWLRSLEIVHVALESTGVFWHPVYNLLEEGRTIVLVNPQHMKAVPGRKTDVKDSEWLADLLHYGCWATIILVVGCALSRNVRSVLTSTWRTLLAGLATFRYTERWR